MLICCVKRTKIMKRILLPLLCNLTSRSGNAWRVWYDFRFKFREWLPRADRPLHYIDTRACAMIQTAGIRTTSCEWRRRCIKKQASWSARDCLEASSPSQCFRSCFNSALSGLLPVHITSLVVIYPFLPNHHHQPLKLTLVRLLAVRSLALSRIFMYERKSERENIWMIINVCFAPSCCSIHLCEKNVWTKIDFSSCFAR